MKHTLQLIAPPYSAHESMRYRDINPAAILEGKVKAPDLFHWVPVIEDEALEYDTATQRRVAAWVRQADAYRKTCSVVDLTPEEIAAASVKTWPNKAAFREEFTSEQLAAARASFPLLVDDLLAHEGEVRGDSEKVLYGLGVLVQAGILTEEQKDSILNS